LSEESDSVISTSSDSDTSDSVSESEAEEDLNALIDKARKNAEAAEKLLQAQEEDQEVITLDHDEQMWVVF
jgi:hypothetical protein